MRSRTTSGCMIKFFRQTKVVTCYTAIGKIFNLHLRKLAGSVVWSPSKIWVCHMGVMIDDSHVQIIIVLMKQ